jgi:DNA-binding response OmpR family regulator
MGSGRAFKILVVEDDPQQAEILRRWLGLMRAPSFEPVLAASLSAALAALSKNRFDVVLLDRVLGDGDGQTLLGVIRRHRSLRDLPVFLMSGLCKDKDIAAGLTRGADEYLSKPMSLEVLTARLLSVMRRCRPEALDLKIVDGPGFRLDVAGRLLLGERVERLEPKEAELLAVLLHRPNMIHSADDLREMVWGESVQPRNTLESRLYTLRRKLGVHAARLETIRGRGYRFLF